MQRICSIYRSEKNEGMYLYVDKAEGLTRVPEALLLRFGKAELAMTLLLHPERKLARADVATVLQAIADNGFFLQLPPRTEHDSIATHIINESF
jgi:hypothetical protein